MALLLVPVCAPLAKRFWARAEESLDYVATPDTDEQGQTLLVSGEYDGQDTPLTSGFATPRLSGTQTPLEPEVVQRAVLSLSVQDAEAAYVSALSRSGIAGDEGEQGGDGDVFDFVAAGQVVDVMFELASRRFVEVSGSEGGSGKVTQAEVEDAVRSVSRLGPGLKSQRVREVVETWKGVCGTNPIATRSSFSVASAEGAEGESEKLRGVRALVYALELYGKVYPDSVSTPTIGGAGAKTGGSDALALRVALGNGVFDSSEELESARDRMVDRLIEE
ncbi:hypothetical protein BDV93DRAFT_46089 [Ceratobasidium sp. AG-I]|nr:hypothetical protein BDV93DRAFT_46089 [Ceratobasidium sp. AG-I]